MPRTVWLIPAVFILSLIASWLIWGDRLMHYPLAVGPTPAVVAKQTAFAKLSPRMAAAMERTLPADFQCDEKFDKTIHRIDDAMHIDILLDVQSFHWSSMRRDAPVKAHIAGKRLKDALLELLNACDPPLVGYGDSDLLIITAPSFPLRGKLYAAYAVGDFVATPAEGQQLASDLNRRIRSESPIQPSTESQGKLQYLSGNIVVTESPLFQYIIAQRLNVLHRRQAIIGFAERTALLCAGAVAAMAIYLRWQARRKLMRVGLCQRCGYDLRASVGRCPECGTEFTEASPARAETPPAPA